MWNKIKIYEIKQNKITQDKSQDRNKDKNKSRQHVGKIEKKKYMAIEN